MEMIEIRQSMVEIVERQVDGQAGVHWVKVRDEFARTHPTAITDLGEELAWKQLGRLAEDAIKPMRSKSKQLPIPGMETIPATVTVPDGEGSYVVKAVRWAAVADLEADRQIHGENVAAAVEAERQAVTRNRVLIPVMEEHGFQFAGEAIEWLSGEAA